MSETKAEKRERKDEEAADEAAEIRAEDRAAVKESHEVSGGAHSFKGAVKGQNVTRGPAWPAGKTPWDKAEGGAVPVANPMRGTNPPLPGIR